MEKALIFVDDGFFGLVKKHFQKQDGKPKKYLQTFRNICTKESLNLEHLFMSRNLTKTPAFKLEWFLEHPKNEASIQTSPLQESSILESHQGREFLRFKVGWRIVFLIYTAPPFQSPKPTQREDFLMSKYQNMTKMLRKKKWITLREGRCQRVLNEDGTFDYRQKGVDALVIMDMYDVKENYHSIKKIILIASDSDFVPLIERMKQRGFEVIVYTYFDRLRNSKFSTSNQLLKIASRWEKLTKEHFE